MNEKAAIILQARMGSTRLPKKMGMEFHNGNSLLGFIIDRLKTVDLPLIVATSTSEEDQEIVSIAEEYSTTVFRGSEEDVLGRFIDCAEYHEVRDVIRVCADNPFIQPSSLEELASRMNEEPSADYIGYTTSEGIPTIRTHWGFWGEGVRLDALKKAAGRTDEPFYREHVTNYIYFHPDEFDCNWIRIPEAIDKASDIRLTIDTKEDLDIAKEVVKSFPEKLDDPEGLIDAIQMNPDWLEQMSRTIKQHSK